MNRQRSLFNPARSNNRFWNLFKTFFQTSIFWLLFLFLIPIGILKIETSLAINGFQPIKEIGWILFTIFSILGLYSGYTMSWVGEGTPLPLDCPNKLVIKGPYKFVRNPMAVAGIGQAVCVGIILGSFMVILYALSGAILWHILVRPIEENDLAQRFGEQYQEYRSRIKCWIPRISK